MNGQGNYTSQVGQDPYVRPPAFQQLPAASTTSTSHHGPPTPQSQAYQQGHPSSHPTPGFAAYQHAPHNVLHQGPPAPHVSGGLSYVQSYLHHPRPPHMNTRTSFSYPPSEQHSLPWNRNVHQLPPAQPLPVPSAYQLPPPPSLPPFSSSSSASMSDTFGSSVLQMREHFRQQPMVPVLPPPPPPPPPSSSPPGVPPIPPSAPPSDIISKRDEGESLKVLLDGNKLMTECPTPVEDRSAQESDFPFQQAEKSGSRMVPMDAVVAYSPTDSDMDMEDDITHPVEESKNGLFINSNDEHVSKSQEDYAQEQLPPLQQAGVDRLSENALHGNLLLAEASVSKAEREGSGIASECHSPVTMKITFEADNAGMSGNGQAERSLDVSVEDSSSQHKNLSPPCVPVLSSGTGNGKLHDQDMEGANPFKLLQGYTSDISSEKDEGLLRNAGPHFANDGSTIFDAEKGCDLGSDLRQENATQSNKPILSMSMVESPRNVMEADKLSVPTQIIEEISDRSHKGQEPVSSRTGAHQLKDSRNYDDNTGHEGANLHKPDMKSNSSKLNVDEFGRLVREGVSDSDTSDSPDYARRHAKRTRKRSRSRSRSRSPHDRRRRRRRSPRRRKERRSRSRSLSPRRRSRSRSPVFRRDSEFGGDKSRRGKGQIPECFDFLRGKCYRGATCRYSHHELNKSERSRYNRDKQHYRDALQSPDFHEESKKTLPDKTVKNKGLGLPEDMPGSREAKDVKRLPVDFSIYSPSKNQSLFPEAAAPYPDDISQTVYQQGKKTDDTPVSESYTPAHAIAAISAHHPADKLDAIPYSTEEVPSQSLKEQLPYIANHPPQLTVPFASASQAVTAPFAQPITQDDNSKPPISWNHMIPENNYQAPVYQHSHFPGPPQSLSRSFLPPPPPPPPPPPTGEHCISSQHMQQPLLPPWVGVSSYTSMRAQPTELPYRPQTGQYQAYVARKPDQMPHSTDSFGSNSLPVNNPTSHQGGPHIMGDRLSGHSVQGMNPSPAQSQPNSLLMQSPMKGLHGSIAGGLPSDSVSHSRLYSQQASYGMQYSGAGAVIAKQHSEPGTVNSSASRIAPDFLERNHPSYVRDFAESRNLNYFNPYASSFDLPPSSKFSSNVPIQENDATINTNYGAPVGLSTARVDEHKTGNFVSKNASVLPRPGGNQYDPYFDSIEPASNSFSNADYEKHETTADSDDVLRFGGSGRVLNMEGFKLEGGTAASANDASANDSLAKEECGETADAVVDSVLDGTPSNHDDATDTNAGEIETDQVTTSGKKKKSKERSMKLFKVSVATFVKEVLKPSWRQGNMSKEAFKTIVKKTVDKVSGAMKSHQIPKSQAKINHYIDSSRGKLTKLVMGYVDKYVKA